MSKKDPVTDTLHGMEVSDPYRWLEDSDDPEVHEWTEDRNARIEKEIKNKQFKQISDELVNNYQTTSFSTPKYVNGRYFYVERKQDEDQYVLYVKEAKDATPKTIFNPNGKKEGNTLAITYWSVSRTGRFVSFGVSEDGNEMATLRVYDVENDSMLDDAIINCRFASTTWLSDDSGFYYVRNPRPGEVPEGEMHMHPKVYFHKLGDDPEDDELIFGEDRPKEDMPKIGISPDDSYLSIRVGQDWTENDIFIYEIDTGEITKIINGDEFYSDILFLQDKAILYTNYQADNGRILSSSYENLFQSIDQWQELISERGYPLKSYVVTANKIIVHYLVDVTSEVVAFDYDGNKQSEFPLPENSSMIGIRADRKEKRFFYSVDSFIQTRKTYEFDPETGEHIVYRQEDNPLNPDNYVVTQEWCESHDGTEVPMFVMHHKDVERNEENPTILYGYGGYGISKTPGFSRTRVSWLNRGGVFVIANIRGGGEFGESWHKDGIKENKPNTFQDLIAAGEYLINKNYTSRNNLGIYGGSNGGLTVGAAATMRPDLFQAVCADVPLLDTVRFHKFGMAVRWIHEYGNPEDPEDLKQILEWSPYHNVDENKTYPHFLLATAKQDTRVHPMHARKMGALLQEKNAENDTYVYTEKKAGHGPGTPIHKVVEKQAIVYTFFAQKLGLEV